MAVSTKYIKDLIMAIGFIPENGKNDVYVKSYPKHFDYSIEVDFNEQKIKYGDKIIKGNETSSNFSKEENFVDLECVDKLLEKGYKPENIYLEMVYPSGRGHSGNLDILIYDDDKKPFLMIECKTWGAEHTKEYNKMLKDGGQLFTYYGFDTDTKYLCLYSSRLSGSSIDSKNDIVPVCEEWKTLSGTKERHSHWNKTFKDNGIFESYASPYDIKHRALTYGMLKDLKEEDSGKIFNQIMEILRHNVVSDKPNAFNKLLNLFVCKIIDENKNPDDELSFQWLEADTDETLQMRLNDLYKDGMWRFLNISVIDYSENEVNDALKGLQADESFKQAIKNMFIETRLKKSPNFAFKEVLNQKSFEANAQIVREIVELLQGYKFRYEQKHQFLGEFFELLLNTSMKQESGQFFTPVPITRFIISSLPIKEFVADKIENNDNDVLPFVIDYATGSGHFLTEYMEQVQTIIENSDTTKTAPTIKNKINSWKNSVKFDWAKQYVYGVELDDRLVKTAKVSAFFNGDGEANIIWGNGLDNFKSSTDYRDKLKITDRFDEKNNGQFDILISNPPYSVEAYKSMLKDGEETFELYSSLTDNSSEIECLFVERMKQLLKVGGWAGVILPVSILSNVGIHSRAREIIFKYFKVKSIVELGSNTFMATGTNTVILFLERRADGDYREIENAVDNFFDNKKDVTVSGIERAFSKYVANVYDGLSFEDYLSLANGRPGAQMLSHELWLDCVKEFGRNIYTSMVFDERKKIEAYLVENLNNGDDTGKIRSADVTGVKMKVNKFFVDYKEFSAAGIAEAVYEFVKSQYGSITFDDYISFLRYHPNEKMKGHYLYLDYIAKICRRCIDFEKEKMLYFILTYNQEVVIVKTGKKQEEKMFLGYEFSNRRGHEGLHWLPSGTKLYNDNDLLDRTKANSYVCNAFKGKKNDVDESLMSNISYGKMSSYFEYGTSKFDKRVNLNKKRIVSIGLGREYPIVRLGEISNIQRGTSITKSQTAKGDVKVIAGGKEYAYLHNEHNREENTITVSGSGANAGFVNFWNEKIFASDCNTIKADEDITTLYIYRCLISVQEQIYSLAQGQAQPHVYAKDLANIKISLPPIDIQREIVKELDKIDDELHNTNQIISSADSSIEAIYLQEKNEYSITRLSNVVEIISGGTPKTSISEYWNGDIPWLSIADFNGNNRFVSKSEKTITQLGFEKSNTNYLQKGEVIISARGTVGALAQVEAPMTFNQSCYGLRGNKNINNGYLYYALKYEIEQLKQNSYGTVFDAITVKTFDSIFIPLPPLKKQKEIVAQIERYETEITKANAKLEELEQSKKDILDRHLQ